MNESLDTARKRLREFREAAKLSRPQLAAKVGAGPTTITKLEVGERQLSLDWIERLATALGKTTRDFLAPEHEVELSSIETIRGQEYAVLPRYAIIASAGDGAFAQDGEPDGYHVLPHQWLKSVTRARLNDLCVIQVSGDSMWETLHNGDHVLVDRSRKTLARPGIYVLDDQGELIVKRVQKDLQTGHIDVISDNPRYPKMTVTEEGRLTVVGRVVWIGRALG
jgi:phage repressor protein C with HTH and peptisase S24 domain